MKPLEFDLVRDTFVGEEPGREGYCLGRLYADGVYIGFTLEDQDRELEKHLAGDAWKEVKVHGKTAIPLGRWPVRLDFSPRFGRELPHILVPTHTGVRVHGANRPEQLEGCVATGTARIARGVANCDVVVRRVVELLKRAEAQSAGGDYAYLTVTREYL